MDVPLLTATVYSTLAILLLTIHLAECQTVPSTTDSGGDVVVVDDDESQTLENPFDSPLSTGGTLWCFECKETYKYGFDPLDSPCYNNLSAVTLRQCDATHTYCRVERTDIYGWDPYSMERGCTSICNYGCKFNGYGITYQKCTSCCKSDACNSDNMAASHVISPALIVACIVCIVRGISFLVH